MKMVPNYLGGSNKVSTCSWHHFLEKKKSEHTHFRDHGNLFQEFFNIKADFLQWFFNCNSKKNARNKCNWSTAIGQNWMGGWFETNLSGINNCVLGKSCKMNLAFLSSGWNVDWTQWINKNTQLGRRGRSTYSGQKELLHAAWLQN